MSSSPSRRGGARSDGVFCPRCGARGEGAPATLWCERCARAFVAASAIERGAGDPLLGALVLERFVVFGLRGSGQRASAYDALDRARGDRAVVKVMRVDVDADAPAFEREARILDLLRLDVVPRVRALGALSLEAPRDRALPPPRFEILAMDAAQGESLAARVAGGAPVAARVLLGSSLEALAAMHGAGVAHGDLKPSHLYVDREGALTGLVDFGCATSPFAPASVGRTPAYAQPGEPDGSDSDRFGRDLHALAEIVRRTATAPASLDPGLVRALDFCAGRASDAVERDARRALQILAES
jgi:serine/threonine protein kinase